MTAPHIVDPARLLDQAVSDASPDLMRHLLSTVINALCSLAARPARDQGGLGVAAAEGRGQVDTSGSKSVDDAATCRSEIETIARKMGMRGDQLLVTEVDASVQSSVRYNSAKALGGIHGRGGTDMRVGIRHALERRNRADVLITMTDGESPWPSEPTRVPLIVLTVGNPGAADPPRWIKTIRVDRQGA